MIVLKDDAPIVRRPAEQREVAHGPQRVPDRLLESDGVADDERLAPAFIAQVRNALTVLAPQRIGLTHPGSRGEISNRTVLHRNAEHITARGDEHAFGGGRQRGGGDVLDGVLPAGSGLVRLHREDDRKGADLAGADIERLQPAAGLVHESVAVDAGATHVPGRFVRELAHLVGGGVVEEKIRRALGAVGNERNVPADPQWV